jgi:hypothetical protein
MDSKHHKHVPLSLTIHAQRRMQERSIPPAVIDALLDFGERRPAGGGAESIYFTKRTWQRFATYVGRAIKGYERYRNCYLIEGENGSIITPAFRH